jgi:hypothetical protein
MSRQLLGVKRTRRFEGSAAVIDPKRTSLHCTAFAPIIYLDGLRKPREAFWGSQASVNCAVIPLQRLNLLICSLFALCRWNQMPLGAFPRHVRIVVAASICLGVAATTRPSQKYNRDQPMNTADKLYRFAAECEFMAKLTHNPKNKTIWAHMAERWIRCAELFDRQSSAAEPDGSMKRHRKTTHHWAH